jgi:hypothetical protein
MHPVARVSINIHRTIYIEILERFQSKALRMIVDAPWYVPNTIIRRDLQILTAKEEIRRYRLQIKWDFKKIHVHSLPR